MYTFDQHLWVTYEGRYKVVDSNKIVLYGRRIDSIGKLASRLRKIGPGDFWAKLPDVPDEIREAILQIASDQDGWFERQAEQKAKIDAIGRWE